MTTISLFQNTSEYEAFTAGHHIFDEGEAGEVMYVVVEGEVNIMVRGRVIETVGPGEVLGEMVLVDASPRSASAVAKTDCKLVLINERRFQFLVQQTPYFAIQIMQIMANRLRRMNAQL